MERVESPRPIGADREIDPHLVLILLLTVVALLVRW